MRNINSPQARKVVGFYMGENTYASVGRRVDPIDQDHKYRAMVEKLIQLELNDWPKFQELLKKLHLIEFPQVQTQWQEVTNKEKSSEVVQIKTHRESITQTWTTLPKSGKSPPTKEFLPKSPIRLLKSIKDRLKTLSPKKLEQLKQKPAIGQAGKIHVITKINNKRPGSVFKLLSAKFDKVPSVQCSGIDKIPTKIL